MLLDYVTFDQQYQKYENKCLKVSNCLSNETVIGGESWKLIAFCRIF